MSEFRKVLDAHVRGQAALPDVEQALLDSLQRETGLGAAHGALIEALYRSEQLPVGSYTALMTRLTALRPARPLSWPSPTNPPSPSIASDDRTIFRPRPGTAASAHPSPAASSDKTILRAPPAAANMTARNTTSASSWSHPSHWTPTDSAPLTSGSVIKDRFVLEEKIGQGGMGTVFKARDRRKEEAQDRNPYVAIKVLNEDFKRHPRSLQALQREARKAQALQHPNIVTVYDFDRDGTNVYMVMELLEGEPLDRLIKRHKGVGLERPQALQIAREICKGIGYAHGQGIVHADFKPANAFLLNDGTVKIFDFGIARAVKHGTRNGGEYTTFDPGTLGALTPAYASREVALGQEPESGDDVYAIACVIYELLTGTHPYNGVAADVASAQELVPQRPAGLSWGQWRVLRDALDFARTRRPSTANELLHALAERRKPVALYAGAAAAALIVLIGGVMLMRSHLAAARERDVAEALASADSQRIEAVIPALRDLNPARRAAILLDEKARTGAIRYYEQHIEESVNSVAGRYDLPAAEKLFAELDEFLPDSQAVKNIGDRLRARKQEEDARLAQAQATLAAQDRARAGARAPAVAREVSPSDMSVDELRSAVTAGLEKPWRTLAEARTLASLIAELGTRDAADAPELKRTVKLKLANDIAVVRRREGVDAAIRFAEGAYALYPDSPVLRKSLTQLRVAAAEVQAQQREIDLGQAKRKLLALLDDRSVDDAWPEAVEAALQRVISGLSPSDIFVQQAQIRIAVLYLTRSATLRQARRLDEASRMLEAARTHGAPAASISSEEKQLALAQANFKVEQAGRDKVAQIEANKQKLLAQAQANEVVEALETLDSLRSSLPRKDPFIAEQAPAAIASAYLRVASAAARDGRLSDAISLVGRGRAVSRMTPEITRALNRYERYRSIERELTDGNSIDIQQILNDLTRFAGEDAEEEATVARWMIRKVVTRANTTSSVKVASRLTAIARQLSEHQAALSGQPSADVPPASAERS